ncbi:MAG: hypothetical protein AAFY54_01845 [Cyanobacteria bacterium J06648_10]
MGITLAAGNLVSRAIRQNVTKSSNGVRVLNTVNRFLTDDQQDDGSGLGRFFGGLLGFGAKSAGWIAESVLGITSFTFSSLWGWMVNAGQRIVNFDWNASDAELKQAINAGYVGAASSWGSFVGSGLGWAAGIGLGYGVSMICPVIGGAALARYVSGRVVQEAIPEITQNLVIALRQTLRAMANQASIGLYINSRKWLKRNADSIASIVGRLGYNGDLAKLTETIDQWGSDNGPRVTIADSFEQQIEKLPLIRQIFVEEVVDEFFDSFIEAGYIVAGELDTAMAAAKAANPEDPERGVLLYPDRDNPSEKIVLAGKQNELIPQVQGILANQRALTNREVGQLVGMPVDDYVRERDLTLRLKFELFDKPAPPYYGTRGNDLTRVAITVPDVKRSALDWTTLKLALGGSNGYTWGRFKARGRISGKRYVTAYGATEAEAVRRLRAVMELSESTILTINVTEELKTNERLINPRLQKESTQVYPGYVSIVNRDRTIAADQGRASVDSAWVDKRNRFELWRTTPPIDFDDRVRELLRFAN